MNPERLQYLFERYFEKTATEAERDELGELLTEAGAREKMLQLFAAAWEKYEGDGEMVTEERTDEILNNILKGKRLHNDENKNPAIIREIRPARRVGWGRVATAAIIVLLLGAGSYWYIHQQPPKNDIAKAPVTNDVKAPAANRATITLGNGQMVFLDSAKNGSIAMQGQLHIVKEADGKIAYAPDTDAGAGEVFYNTLTNPRGSKPIDLTLSDGSRVWLNAASSLKYPTAFAGKERKVEVTGEAYFEVFHDPDMPFIASKGSMNVKVLGTHFNVNAYDDESSIKVTLLEGSVQVSKDQQIKKIKPGDQAQVTENDIKLFTDIDTDEVMAWKKGEFIFGEKADVHTIMRQLARWYDIDVEYKGIITEQFGGSIPRSNSVAQVLQILQKTGRLHYSIEGKKVTITP